MIVENINVIKLFGVNINWQGNIDFNVLIVGFFGGLFVKVNLLVIGVNKFVVIGGVSVVNMFNGMIMVIVINVLLNGNFVVSGEKQMLINQGNEFVCFLGVVNLNMILGVNFVYLMQVVDVKIEYLLKGYINEVEMMGWLQCFFFNIVLW